MPGHDLSASIDRVLAAFAPIWALTAVGYLVGRSHVLGGAAVDVLGRFVFYVAMPAALLSLLTREPLTGFAGKGLAAFVISTFVVGGLGFALARHAFRRPLGDQAITGMAAGYVNAANLGIPVAVQVIGNASFLAVVLLFQVLVAAPIILALLDASTRESPARRWRRVLTLPLRNPILVACVVGVVVGSADLPVPDLLGEIVALLGAAAVPTALIALGLSLAPRPEADGRPRRPVELTAVVGLKILVQPLLAYLLGRLVFDLDGPVLLAVVICAGLPNAQNTFIFARAYGADGRFARDTVVASTALSMITLTIAAALLSS